MNDATEHVLTVHETVVLALSESLRHFVHLDESNAAVHCSEVRYSPITFRCAEALLALGVHTADEFAARVLAHVGHYEEDRGR